MRHFPISSQKIEYDYDSDPEDYFETIIKDINKKLNKKYNHFSINEKPAEIFNKNKLSIHDFPKIIQLQNKIKENEFPTFDNKNERQDDIHLPFERINKFEFPEVEIK